MAQRHGNSNKGVESRCTRGRGIRWIMDHGRQSSRLTRARTAHSTRKHAGHGWPRLKVLAFPCVAPGLPPMGGEALSNRSSKEPETPPQRQWQAIASSKAAVTVAIAMRLKTLNLVLLSHPRTPDDAAAAVCLAATGWQRRWWACLRSQKWTLFSKEPQTDNSTTYSQQRWQRQIGGIIKQAPPSPVCQSPARSLIWLRNLSVCSACCPVANSSVDSNHQVVMLMLASGNVGGSHPYSLYECHLRCMVVGKRVEEPTSTNTYLRSSHRVAIRGRRRSATAPFIPRRIASLGRMTLCRPPPKPPRV
ncbi:hypothetical protein G7046_g7728 [Stylonectria norvegica]|nr:hypothetical protein G7046_g7728 [Stylonectria norvegica]